LTRIRIGVSHDLVPLLWMLTFVLWACRGTRMR
jgi:hypothetical protein